MIAFLLIAFCNVVSPFNSESVVEAEDLCDDYICVNGREKDGEVVFYLSNRQSVPITVSVAVELENMTSSVKLPYTITLRKFGYERAFRIFPRNRKLPSKFNVKSSWVFGVKGAVHDESTVYQLPFPKDKKYILSQGPFSDSSHKGKYAYDFGMPEGSRVLAARAGKVVGVEDRHERSGSEAEYAEFNNFVFIEHNDGTIGKYLHLKKGGARVELGSSVKAGDLLGLSGSVGRSNGPHLHFEVVSAIDGYRDKTFPLHFELERRGVISLVDGDECIPPVNRAW
jgi:murein DD-endopeptidase MepM/ murein hydrolase activator NlpD